MGTDAKVPSGVTGFVQNNVLDAYVLEVPTDLRAGMGAWRAIVSGIAYMGFETRLEALVFVSIKKTESLAAHVGITV